MGTADIRDRLIRILVEEGVKDAERDIAWYGERIRADIRDGIAHDQWVRLRDEAKAVARAFRGVLAAADKATPDPIDLAKAAAEVADMAPGSPPPRDFGTQGWESGLPKSLRTRLDAIDAAADDKPWADGIEQYQVESR